MEQASFRHEKQWQKPSFVDADPNTVNLSVAGFSIPPRAYGAGFTIHGIRIVRVQRDNSSTGTAY